MAVGSLSVDINANLQGLEQGLSKAEQETNSAGQSMADAIDKSSDSMQSATKDTSDSFDKMGNQFNITSSQMSRAGTNLTKFVTTPLLGIGTAGLYMASQLEATEAKYNTVFDSMTDSMDEFIVEWQTLVPVTTAGARSIASSIQDLLIPMGFTREEATALTQETLTLVGALANFNSATHSAEDVTQAFTSALTGEYQSLKALGIQTSAEAVRLKAVEMGLADSTKEVDQQAQALALIEIAYEQSGDALNAFNEESLDSKTKMAIATAQMKDTIATVAYNFLPIMELATNVILSLSTAFSNLSPTMQIAVVGFGALVASIGPLLKITSLLNDNWSLLTRGFGALTKAMKPATTGFMNLTSSVLGSTKSLGGMTSSISALISPIGLMTAGITATTGALFLMLDTPVEKELRGWNREIKASAEAYDRQNTSLEKNIAETTALVSQLENLSSKSNLTNSEIGVMSGIVDQLNQQIPDLNLSIDGTTGALNQEIEAVKASADAYVERQRQQLYIERHTELMAEAIQAEENYKMAIEEAGGIENVRASTLTNLEGAINRAYGEMNTYGDVMLGLSPIYSDIIAQEHALAESVKGSSDAVITEGQERVTILEGIMQTEMENALSYQGQLQELERTHNANMGSIFDEGVEMREETLDDIVNNLEKQIEQQNAWADELEAISGRVPPAVFEELVKLGPGMTDIIAEANSLSDEEFANIEDIFDERAGTSTRLALTQFEGMNPEMKGIFDENLNISDEYMSNLEEEFKNIGEVSVSEFITGFKEINPELADQLQEMLDTVEVEGADIIDEFGDIGDTSMKDFIKEVEKNQSSLKIVAKETGEDYTQGIINGLNANKGSLIAKAREIAREMNRAFESELEIKSPSRVAMNIGEQYLEGMEMGFENMKEALIRTVRDISSSIVSASTPVADLNGSTSNTTNNITNNNNALTGANREGITVQQNNTFTTEEITPFEASILQRELSKNLANSLRL